MCVCVGGGGGGGGGAETFKVPFSKYLSILSRGFQIVCLLKVLF